MASPEERAAAADPRTDLTELARLAHEHPDLRTVVAGNPSAYEGLLQWLGGIGDPAVNAALAARGAAPVAAPQSAGWHEPARDVPLQWGSYEVRYVIGLGLLLLGMVVPFSFISSQGFNNYSIAAGVTALVLPAALQLIGVVVMPSPAGRRGGAAGIVVVATIISFVFGYALGYSFGSVYSLPGTLSVAALPLLVWLMLRERPGMTYLLLIAAVVLGVGAVFLLQRTDSVVSYVLVGFLPAIIVAGLAWAARAIHKRRAPMLAQRAHMVAAQQAAYAAAYPQGAFAQSGYVPLAVAQGYAGGPVMSHPGAPTNTTAVLALVFGIGGGLLGIVLGHVARAQIRRTGEGGWALATVGLVFGYIGLGAGVVLGIVYVVMLTR